MPYDYIIMPFKLTFLEEIIVLAVQMVITTNCFPYVGIKVKGEDYLISFSHNFNFFVAAFQ